MSHITTHDSPTGHCHSQGLEYRQCDLFTCQSNNSKAFFILLLPSICSCMHLWGDTRKVLNSEVSSIGNENRGTKLKLKSSIESQLC